MCVLKAGCRHHYHQFNILSHYCFQQFFKIIPCPKVCYIKNVRRSHHCLREKAIHWKWWCFVTPNTHL